MNEDTELARAETILRDYGALLAQLQEAPYGIPESRLPHPKEAIKDAIQHLLRALDGAEPRLVESLVQGYAFLAQFIPDEQARLLHCGQQALRSGDPHHPDWASAAPSSRILTEIKLEMENLLHEIRLLAG